MKPDVIHTLEHLLAFNLRKYIDRYPHFDIIDISPMAPNRILSCSKRNTDSSRNH